MTTINNSENLIEKVGGIEKAREIVSRAPEGTVSIVIGNLGEVVNLKIALFGLAYYQDDGFWIIANPKIEKYAISINNLRTAIAEHDRIDTCSDIANHISPLTKVIER